VIKLSNRFISTGGFINKNKKLHVKIGDTVTVISGFHKNETGEVIKINPKWQDHSKGIF
jgi:transcription antitermination factor NusG